MRRSIAGDVAAWVSAVVAVLVVLCGGLPAAGQQPSGVPYHVTLQGADEGALGAAVRASSALMRLAATDEVAPAPRVLIRRAASDRDAIVQGVRSLGYYGAIVEVTIEGVRVGGEAIDAELEARLAALDRPAHVAISVDPGPMYTIEDITVAMADERVATLVIDPWSLGIDEGVPARAVAVIEAQNTLAQRMLEAGYPFAEVAGRRVTVDHATRTMQIVYLIAPGVEAPLGEVRFEGQERTRPGFLARQVPFRPGTPFRPAELAELSDNLRELAIFRSVIVATEDEPAPDGTVPVVVRLEERPARVIGLGASYSTDEGFGLRAYWGHRNLFGGAEDLRLTVEIGGLDTGTVSDPLGIDYFVGGTLRLPAFPARDFAVVADLAVLRESPDAYERLATLGSVILEYQYDDNLLFTGGVAASWQSVRQTDQDESDKFTLVSLPFTASYDARNSALEPTAGFQLAFEIEPFLVVEGGGGNWLRIGASGSTYFDLSGNGRHVIALRAALAALVGAEIGDVPVSERLFSGGGGSVRGYAFQSVGPLDANANPTGGAGLVEVSAEYRFRVLDSWGGAIFVDAGQVVEDAVPRFNEPLIGVGAGVRYYTGFGPIRLDVAVPVNPRGSDAGFQVYVSIGQAF